MHLFCSVVGARRCAAILGTVLIAIVALAQQWPNALAAPLASLFTQASAAEITANRWETYVNTRYGVLIDYPTDLFAIQPPPPDNAGRNFEAPTVKARFFVYSHANALDQTLAEIQAGDVSDLGDAAATKQHGDDWYQIVARKGSETVLLRVLLSEGGSMVHRLQIAYPIAAADAFAPIVARMIKSFHVDSSIPEKAAGNAAKVSPVSDALQRIDSIALGLHIPGFRGKVGISADVPVDWIRSELPEPNSLEFDQPQPSGNRDFYVIFSAEARRSSATLANEAKVIKTRMAEQADKYRLLSERKAKIALRPAIVLSMQYAASDSDALLHENVAIIDVGQVFYFVHFGSPQSRAKEAGALFDHIIETIAFAE